MERSIFFALFVPSGPSSPSGRAPEAGERVAAKGFIDMPGR